MDLSFFNDLNSGVALAVLGYFGFILKDIPTNIWSFIRQKLSITIQSDNNNNMIYVATNKYCIEKFPELKNHIQTESNYEESQLTDENIACGTYIFLYDFCTYVIVNKTMTSASISSKFKYVITITGVGFHRTQLISDYKENLSKYLPDMSRNIILEGRNVFGDYLESIIPKKSFDDVFCHNKDEIIELIEKFKNNKQMYLEHGIVYKTGFLFYGKPGSGKSTLARAIASYLNWNIVMCTSKHLCSSDINNKVVLFEDIDCITENREDKRTSTNDHTYKRAIENFNLQDVLNLIDGVSSPSNCIFIATTNYLDQIDPALRRKGRFDHIYEITYLDEALAKEMCDRYEVPYSFLDGYTFPVSAADLQAKIMYHKISN